jgi:hypothetical protein
MAQVVERQSPEFKSESHQKKKKKERIGVAMEMKRNVQPESE